MGAGRVRSGVTQCPTTQRSQRHWRRGRELGRRVPLPTGPGQGRSAHPLSPGRQRMQPGHHRLATSPRKSSSRTRTPRSRGRVWRPLAPS